MAVVRTTIRGKNNQVRWVHSDTTNSVTMGHLQNICGRYGIQTYFKGNISLMKIFLSLQGYGPHGAKKQNCALV